MSLWIKICGNTSLEDALLGVEAGVDALGFVFAPSPRRVTAEQGAAITLHLPGGVEKIGVFVDSALDEIVLVAQTCGLTGVQLHFAANTELTAALRKRLGPGVRILRVVPFGQSAVEQTAASAGDPNVDAVLIDSRTPNAAGGTGIAFAWELAGRTLFQSAKERRLIAAGGLHPDNVAEAIDLLRPWGVDVVSGVESVPGRKDPAKVRAFVGNARAAASSY